MSTFCSCLMSWPSAWRRGAVAAAVMAAAGVVRADGIWLATGSSMGNVTVREIQAAEVVYDAGKETGRRLPLDQVKKIQFSAFPVVAKPGGVILVNGTRLNGVLYGIQPKCRFRSTSLGPLELPLTDVAAITYAPGQPKKAPAAGTALPVAVDSFGNQVSGRLLWADANSAGIRSEDGLKKMAAVSLAYVQLAAWGPAQTLVLRNGDVLNGPRRYNGTTVTVDLGPCQGTVSLEAIAEIQF